ncbi:unnamed protein product [Kluyveromyces dobzhanskii CBS 2104]|uniref:WGS project CCBQ000000000 data, contig 00015 n=1 Tax=Kluyveromyces dobzhanskii CBS 2104 TaxID=1427455 RepID=A0A0A8LCS3_9SACH|nr:unnamed protein product [Kluyveromyces dobzhanskii CBS 2104]
MLRRFGIKNASRFIENGSSLRGSLRFGFNSKQILGSTYGAVVTRAQRNYYVPPNHDTRKKRYNWVFGLGVAGALSFGLWWFYYPHHNYPRSVSKLLRKALWEESDKKEFNYQGALKYYIEALEQCEKIQMDPLSDEYTGIQLKIAEMYEHLNFEKEANSIYWEMVHKYYQALNTPGKIPEDLRPHVVQKDLRVLIKALEQNDDLMYGKKVLLSHLLLAQEEILSRSSELKSYFDSRKQDVIKSNKKNGHDIVVIKQKFDPDDFLKAIKVDENGCMILDLHKNSSAWEPLKEEFFTARDLYTAYCLSTKDILSALGCKMTTVQWMVLADMAPGQILLSQANLGSLLYLQTEQVEGQLFALNQVPDDSRDDKFVDTVGQLKKQREVCLDLANRCYQSVVSFGKKNKKLRFQVNDLLDPSASQAIALSTYGMGVISLHRGEFSKAERMLNESLALAKETDFQELIEPSEVELEKVSKARANPQILEPFPIVSENNPVK